MLRADRGPPDSSPPAGEADGRNRIDACERLGPPVLCASTCIPTSTPRTNPDKPAYIMAGSGETVTYRQLDQQSNRIAQLFRSLGLKAGDHIALFLENNARFFEICWGAQRSGLIYTAISSRLTAAEVDYIVTDCGARLFVTSKYLADKAAELAPLLKGVEKRYMIDGTIAGYDRGRRRWRAVPRRRSPTRPPATTCSIRRAPPAGPRACCRSSSRSRSTSTIRCSRSPASSTAWTRTRSICRRRRSITPLRCAST